MSEAPLVVCFGAGRVAGPFVERLLRAHPDVSLCVASAVAAEAEQLCNKYKILAQTTARTLTTQVVDVLSDGEAVGALCQQASCVVALVPEPAQVRIAQACVAFATPLVTASYASPAILALDEAAKEAKIPFLCEMGLDPGMDHMIAMRLIDSVKRRGGKVTSFSSVCGGLPAPDAADNPIKYKFSWSPQGALRAAQRPAQYLKNGETITVAGADVLAQHEPVALFPEHDLEQIPNGYALKYATYYGIPDATTLFRGTLRFRGFCAVMHECVRLGLLDEHAHVTQGTRWREVIAQKLSASGIAQLEPATQAFLEWLGIDSPDCVVAASQSTLAAFGALLERKLVFAPGERDLVLLHVGVGAEFPDGSRETLDAFFDALGEAHGEAHGDTVMAKTVGVTAAVGVELVLRGAVSGVGVVSPTQSEVYTPALELLAAEGIVFEERLNKFMRDPVVALALERDASGGGAASASSTSMRISSINTAPFRRSSGDETDTTDAGSARASDSHGSESSIGRLPQPPTTAHVVADTDPSAACGGALAPADAADGPDAERASLVVAPGLEEVVFENWEAFYAYLAVYQARSYQHFRLRSTTSVDERNRRIEASASRARVIPAEWGVYAKTLVCTHAGKYRYRGTGKRQWHETRPMDCKAKINVCVQWRHNKFVAMVTKADLGHNHQLSKVAYSQYASNRIAAFRCAEPTDEMLRQTGAKRIRGKHLLQARSEAAKRAATDAKVAEEYERNEEPIITHWVHDALYFAHDRILRAVQQRSATALAIARASANGSSSVPPSLAPLTFVDVGCSTGALCLAFAEKYLPATPAVAPAPVAAGAESLNATTASTDASTSVFRVLASDVDARMLARVAEKLETRPRYQRFRSHVSTVQMDGQLLDKLADSSVDIVGSNFGLSIFPDRNLAWRSAARVLRDGGVLFATVWDAQSPNLRWVDGCAALASEAYQVSTAAAEARARDGDVSDSDDSPQFIPQFIAPSTRVGHNSVVRELLAAGLTDVETYRTRHSVMYDTPRVFVDSTLNNPGFATFLEHAGRERLEAFLYRALATEGGFAGTLSGTASDVQSIDRLKQSTRPVVVDLVGHVVVASKLSLSRTQ